MNIELGPLSPEPFMLALGLTLFFLITWTLGHRILPRVERIQTERWDATEGRAERAEAIRAEAEAAHDAGRQELAQARHEAARIRQEYAEQGAAAVAAARAEGVRDRHRLVTATHARIAADRAAAAEQLRQDVGELAVTLAGRVVGEPVHAVAASRRTVDRFFRSR
ncbi:hypothetical protein [Kitasatospora sp. NBC_01300]|uniref:F0F1 ATP synthase subunit B family protein n=1 Tax=Kitasatospora sp. NBC_01300 TaxID=2903574 RepID=UPI00352CF6EE|nr:hypothetical protein OG556_09985 [Kitasatospora sp. NBC_01300]